MLHQLYIGLNSFRIHTMRICIIHIPEGLKNSQHEPMSLWAYIKNGANYGIPRTSFGFIFSFECIIQCVDQMDFSSCESHCNVKKNIQKRNYKLISTFIATKIYPIRLNVDGSLYIGDAILYWIYLWKY